MSLRSDSFPPEGPPSLTSALHPFLLFFDGDCAFCNRWAARVKKADSAHRTRFATLQGPTFQRLTQAHPELGKIDSVVVVKRNSVGEDEFFIRSTAIRKLIKGLPGFQIFDLVLHLVPTPLSDLGYWIFSKLRAPLFGKWHHVRMPIEQDPELFLD